MTNSENGPVYPHINVPLVGQDGNAFAIIGRLAIALRINKIPNEKIKEITSEMTAGDYDHLLRTVMKYVNTDAEVEDLFDEDEEDEEDLFDEDDEDESDW